MGMVAGSEEVISAKYSAIPAVSFSAVILLGREVASQRISGLK